MVRGSWLLKRAMALRQAKAQHGPNSKAVRRLALPRRQDMPEEAFIGPGELKMHEPPGYIGKQWRVAVFACSYCWRTKAHPDPYGETLLMLADALAGMLEKRLRQMTEWATMPKTEFSVLWAYEHFPKEFGVFIDWCSVFQPDKATGEREPAEQVAYDIALNDLELWYAHQLTTASSCSRCPRRRRVPTTTTADGRHTSRCRAHPQEAPRRPLGPDHRRGRAQLDPSPPATDPRRRVPRPRSRAGLYEWSRRGHRLQAVHPHPPPHPPVRERAPLRGCGWQPPEMKRLAKVLPMCVHLRTLKLSNNSLGQRASTSSRARSDCSSACPTCTSSISAATTSPETRTRCRASRRRSRPILTGCHPLRTRAPSEAAPAGLIMLQELHLQECKLGPVGFVNFCRSLRRGALHALLKLGIEGNHIEDAAVEPLTVALANNGAMPKLKFVLGLPARGGITAVETLFKVMGHRRGSWEMMNELKAEISLREPPC